MIRFRSGCIFFRTSQFATQTHLSVCCNAVVTILLLFGVFMLHMSNEYSTILAMRCVSRNRVDIDKLCVQRLTGCQMFRSGPLCRLRLGPRFRDHHRALRHAERGESDSLHLRSSTGGVNIQRAHASFQVRLRSHRNTSRSDLTGINWLLMFNVGVRFLHNAGSQCSIVHRSQARFKELSKMLYGIRR